MKKLVIDSNALQSEELRSFLARSKQNFAILPDFAGIEAYKGDPLKTIFKSMKIVSEFPDQVIILKGSEKVCNLSGRRKGLQRRLVDEKQTAGFADYIRALKLAEAGNATIQEQIRTLGISANEHLNKMLNEIEDIKISVEKLGLQFTKEERRLLRVGDEYSPELINKIVLTVMEMSTWAFNDSALLKRPPTYKELPNTFIFRIIFACFLHSMRRFSQGGLGGINSAKLRNDLVDMMFVAYGSYFDGVMSSDQNVKYMYTETCLLLHSLIDAEIPFMNNILKKT